MASFDEIIKRAESFGYPIAENEFTATKQNPAPALPFVCYSRVERFTGSDDAVRLKTTDGAIEFYTDRKPDAEDLQAIEAFEKKVFFDTDYVKSQIYIRGENMTQTAYDFTVIEKRKG